MKDEPIFSRSRETLNNLTMNVLLLIFVSTVGLATAAQPAGFTYNYGIKPSSYRAVQYEDPVNYVQYSPIPIAYTGAAAPIQYAATPIQYAATPFVTDKFHFVQYQSPIVGASDKSHIFKTFTPVLKSADNAIIQYVSPVVKSTDDNVVQYVSPIVKTSQSQFIPTFPKEIGQSHIVQYSAPPVPLSPNVQHKFHSQSTDGSYAFGYSGGPSSRHEIRDKFGIVHGAFNYVDPEGIIQSQQYVADGRGFRVAATNLPVAPVPVDYTPEVKAARAAHFAYKAKKV